MKIHIHDFLRSISFNPDLTCLICAFAPFQERKGGYGVFSTNSFSRLAWREFETGGFGIAEMYDHTNVVLLVGGRKSPSGFSERSVAFYDDATSEVLWDIKLPYPVLSVQCKRDIVLITLESSIFIYRIGPSFSSLVYETSFSTLSNAPGLCALSASNSAMQVRMPGVCAV